MEESNYYEDKKNREFLDSTPEKNKRGESKPETKEKEETQKEKLTRTAKEIGTDLAVGVLGGGLGAAICGRYSLLTGLFISGWGHYTKNKYIARLGLGLMASSSMTSVQGIKQDPNASMMENMQERVKAFGQELKRKLFLDKLGAAKKKEDLNPDDLNGVEPKSKVPTVQDFAKIPNSESQQIKPENTSNIKPIFNESENPTVAFKKSMNKDDDDDLTSIEEKLY